MDHDQDTEPNMDQYSDPEPDQDPDPDQVLDLLLAPDLDPNPNSDRQRVTARLNQLQGMRSHYRVLTLY